MKRGLAATVVFVVVIGTLPALPGIAGAEAPGTAAEAADDDSSSESTPDEDRAGTWIGTIDGTDVAVAVISDGNLVRAYTCDGGVVSAWFEGELVGSSFAISAPDGSTITGALTDGGAAGVFTSTDGPFSGSFSAARPTGNGGVFRSYFLTDANDAVFIRWIVFDDGSQRGNSETTAAGATETAPAPTLDAPAAQQTGTAPVGPAGNPAPVTQLTPQSIANPIPTTQLAGAPPPIPPPAPPAVQPVALTARVTPARSDVGSPVHYQLSLNNPNTGPLSDVGVRVGLPPGLAVKPDTDRTTCRGTFVAFPPGATRPGQPQLIVSGVALAPGASCTADVDITAERPVAVDVVTDAPTATGAPPGQPARSTFVIGSTVVAPTATPPTTRPSTTPSTRAPPATTTTRPTTSTTRPATTTTTRPTTTTTRPSTTTTTAPRAGRTDVVTAPSAPRNVRGQALSLRANDSLVDGGRVELTFELPENQGGTPVNDFVAQCRPANGTAPAVTAETRSSPVTLGGLRTGTVHLCTVAARNFAGTGATGAVEVIVPRADRPGPPRNVRARVLALDARAGPTGGRIEVSFDPPANSGGAAVSDFLVQCHPAFDATPVTVFPQSSPATLTGLLTGSDHSCVVLARNRAGSGDAVPFEVTIPREQLPSAPRNIHLRVVTEGRTDGQVEVTFDPPTEDGGAPIINFTVACFIPGPLGQIAGPEADGPRSPVTLSGFTLGNRYLCSIHAFNAEGEQGPPLTFVVNIPGDKVPSAPRNVRVRTDPIGHAEVTFDAPEDNGGAQIVNFSASCVVPGPLGARPGPEADGLRSPLTLRGFEFDQGYVCGISAFNLEGEQGEGAVFSVLVPAPPRPIAPRNVHARALPLRPTDGPNDGRAEVRFEKAPGDEGLGFTAQCFETGVVPDEDARPPTTFSETSPIEVPGLKVNREYFCAVSSNGIAEFGEAEPAPELIFIRSGPPPRPPDVPSAPRNVRAHGLPFDPTAGRNGGRVEITFEPPARNGGALILTYVAECVSFPFGEASPGPEADGVRSPLTLIGLEFDLGYQCSVTAINGDGEQGPPATVAVNLSGTDVPSAPRNVRARPVPLGPTDGPDGGHVEITFDPPARNGGAPIESVGAACISFPFGEASPGPAGDAFSSPLRLSGFRVDVEYDCSVIAFNAAGEQSPPATVSVTVPGQQVPSAPRNVRARALPLGAGDGPNDGRVQVSFEPPARGAADVGGYTVECVSFPFGESSPGPEADGLRSPIELTGFEVGLQYFCSIHAFNQRVEPGPAVTANGVTVAAPRPPTPPRNLRARVLPPRGSDGPDDGRVEFTFDRPENNGGVDVTSSGVECDFFPFGEASPGPRASGPSSPLTATGFTLDTEYFCTATAVNRHGLLSAPSETVNVKVPGVTALVASVDRGSSPLPETFDLAHPPRGINRWELDFGDGTPKVRGNGAFRPVPHVYVSRTNQPATLEVSLKVNADGRDTVFATRVQVLPGGTGLTLEGTPAPPTVRRGEVGTINLVVGNPNATPAPTLSMFSATDGVALSASGGWDCSLAVVCQSSRGLDPFANAPPLQARFTVPADAPATFEAVFQVIAEGGGADAVATVRVPVTGVVAKAGPDQTVDAVTPQPDGSLAPTQVLLDGIESLGLEGRNVGFAWRQVGGQPRVRLRTNIDPSGRVVTFDAPPVTGATRLEFELTVTEGRNSSTDRVVVTVVPRNQPPVLRKIDVTGLSTSTRDTGEVVPRGEGTLTLQADASDPDRDAITTTWRVLTSGVPNGDANGEKLSLRWPVAGVSQVVVEAAVTDPFGAVDTATVTLGVPAPPLGLEVTAPARVDAGERVTARATPSRRSGVRVEWTVTSGPQPAGFPKTGRDITFDAPDVDETDIVLLQVTATETATGASATRVVPLEVQAGAPFSVSVPPALAVDPGEAVSIEATVAGASNATFQWTRTFGPNVQLQGANARTVRFDAPNDAATIGLRLVATGGGTSVTANTVVTVGDGAAVATSGCGSDSAYQRFVDGEPVVLGGGLVVITGHSVQGANDQCDEATLSGVDVILANGLVVGDDLGGTVDEGKVRLTEGDVHLPPAFQLPDIDLGGSPIEVQFDGGGGTPAGGGGGGDPCISWDAALSSAQFPFVPLPPGFSGAGARVALTCTSASITAEATAGGATFAVDADLDTDGGANATVTLENVPALGGTASGTGTVAVAPGGAATYDLTATIADPGLPIPGIALDTAAAHLSPAGLTIEAAGSLGQGNGSLAVTMEGAFSDTGLSLAVEAANDAPWAVGPGLTVEAANLVGTVDVDPAGAATVDLRLSVGGDWRPVPGLRITGLSLQVANTDVPPDCAIPAGGVWVRAGGQGAIDIPGVSPIALAVEACLGVPTGGGAAPFSLRSTVGGAPWAVAPGVVINDVGIQVTLVTGTLTLQASGSARLLGVDLTARVAFLVPGGGGAPTVVVDGSGSLTGIGIPIPEAHVVFASAAVSDFELAPGLEIDLPQGITGVGTIDLGQPIADLLNEAFSPPTPILPTVTVTISFGTAIEIKAAIDLGGDGATLFMGCPGGGTNCNPTAPTTTRLALASAFIRMTLGGAGGISIGFGAEGTLQLPPAQAGSASPPLNLHVEASIQPPARVGLAMFFEGALQNAMGIQGLTLANLGIQGSIDFSTTPVPLVTIGITGQVDRVPNQLASVFGLTNNGEPQRFTLNVDPLAPILELTLGVDDGQIVMRPLTAVGQADALEVDFASVVIAPLGGTVGPVSYSPGVSAGFAANILGVPVHVNASVDIPAAHINGTVEVGTLTVGGVRFEDSTILLDITPVSFRQTLCGGVHIGDTTLQGLLHVQAGGSGGGPASCGGVSIDPGSGAGLRARFRLNAASLPVGPVNVEQFSVDAQAELDALSASFNATLNVTGRLDVLANDLDVDGSVRFDDTGLKELHVKAIGNVNVGGVQVTGNGTCPFPATIANIPGAPRGGRGRSVAAGGAASGACVQLDHAPATSTPFRFGLKGKLTAAGSTASITGTIDQSRTNLTGSLNVPTLGNLDISGTLVFGGGATIANATGANVSASVGDWRVSGRFGSSQSLAGGVSARWDMAAGRVSGGFFVRGSADASIAGATVRLAGTFNATAAGALSYSLSGSSSSTVDSSVNLGGVNAIHTAVRGLFLLPGQRASDERLSDVAQGRFTRGRLYFTASYSLDATLTQSGLDLDEADLSARVRYAERFDRPGDGVDGFNEEASSRWNTIVNFNVDASGIDEFFEMAVGEAATRTRAAGFCFTVFDNELGAC